MDLLGTIQARTKKYDDQIREIVAERNRFVKQVYRAAGRLKKLKATRFVAKRTTRTK